MSGGVSGKTGEKKRGEQAKGVGLAEGEVRMEDTERRKTLVLCPKGVRQHRGADILQPLTLHSKKEKGYLELFRWERRVFRVASSADAFSFQESSGGFLPLASAVSSGVTDCSLYTWCRTGGGGGWEGGGEARGGRLVYGSVCGNLLLRAHPRNTVSPPTCLSLSQLAGRSIPFTKPVPSALGLYDDSWNLARLPKDSQ